MAALLCGVLPLSARPRLDAPQGANSSATQASPAASSAASATADKPAPSAAAKPAAANPESASTSLKASDNNAALLLQISKLQLLTGTNIDVKQRSVDVRAHLNSVLRYYRSATVPVQTVGEPSDVLYAEQNQTEATQIAELAFQAAKNEAALLNRVAGQTASNAPPASAPGAPPSDAGPTQMERIAAIRTQAQNRLNDLQAQSATITQSLTKARGDARAALVQQQEQVQGGIELQTEMVNALSRIGTFSVAQKQIGLAGDIDRLQRSAPELMSKPVKMPAPPVLQSLAAARDAGVTTQAGALFQLLGALHNIDGQTTAIDELSQQAQDLRTPFIKVLRSTIAQGQALTQRSVDLQATPTSNQQDLADTRKQFDALTSTFRVLADATLPLSQEAVLLDNARGTLTTWRSTVDAEKNEILRQLLVRVAFIAVALGVLAVISRLLNRAAVRYVSDLRRRRQLLLLRRVVIGFLSGLILIFGFVTQFSSLATFAGFISAGIAVGLQSILLSVAAYFFIVGRYGIRVGDRVTVAGVTGEVIEVGLVRFYMMELVGTGTELHPTGRVAVFANSVLFQTGTPIYKQMPGTEYAWHELTAKLNSGADVPAATAALLAVVNRIYAGYSDRISSQHRHVEAWMGTALPEPKVESRLELADGGLHFAVLFPVELDSASGVDQQIAEAMVQAVQQEGPLKAGITDLPVIRAAVKS